MHVVVPYICLSVCQLRKTDRQENPRKKGKWEKKKEEEDEQKECSLLQSIFASTIRYFSSYAYTTYYK